MKRLTWFVPVTLLPLVIMAAVAPAAETAADLAKSLSSKKAADRLKAADGLADLGGQAKPAVPALLKAPSKTPTPGCGAMPRWRSAKLAISARP